MLTDLNYIKAESLEHALEVLAADPPSVTPLAGGTNLIVNMRERWSLFHTLLDIKGLEELKGVRKNNGYIVAGGATTIAALLKDPLVAEHAQLLKTSAAMFANPLIRNRATLAGNLVDASPAADTAPPLLALDTEVELTSAGNRKWIALDEFFTGVNQTQRQPNELLTSIRWLVPAGRSKGAFYKVGLRKADAISVLSVAVWVTLDDKGICKTVRIALGAVSPKPTRVYAAEDLFPGNSPDPKLIEEAAQLSTQAASPIDDVRGSSDYRRRVTGVIVRRLLNDVIIDLMK